MILEELREESIRREQGGDRVSDGWGESRGKGKQREMSGEDKMTTQIERWRSFSRRLSSPLILKYFITHCHPIV